MRIPAASEVACNLGGLFVLYRRPRRMARRAEPGTRNAERGTLADVLSLSTPRSGGRAANGRLTAVPRRSFLMVASSSRRRGPAHGQQHQRRDHQPAAVRRPRLRAATTAFLILDTESVPDGRLLGQVKYPGETLSPEEAIAAAQRRPANCRATAPTSCPSLFSIPVAVCVLRVAADFPLRR